VSRAKPILVALALCLLGAAPPAADDGPDPEPPAREKRLEGVWEIEKQFGNGWPAPHGLRIEFARGRLYFVGERGGRGEPTASRLWPRKRPAEIDIDFGGAGVRRAIYKIEDGKLYLTWAEEKGGKRPASFDGKGSCVRVLKRVGK
jgi:uncharacterized protein (TIGR03067 family)